MRISDWSSDVGSSDLPPPVAALSRDVDRNPGETAEWVDRQQRGQRDRPVGLVGDRDVVGDRAGQTVEPCVGEQDIDQHSDVIEGRKICAVMDTEPLAVPAGERRIGSQSVIVGRKRSEESRVGKEWCSKGSYRGGGD